MKIIEAMKKIKDTQRKIVDLQEKIKVHCAHMDIEGETYPDQKGKVSGWLQSIEDMVQEIAGLRIAIQRTNLATMVDVDLGGKTVTKSIAEWIHRRRDLANICRVSWKVLGDRGLRSGKMQMSNGEEKEVKLVRCYDPAERDKKVDVYSSEPMLIDARLEVVNAVTDLV